jgi:hypothetical protein
MCDKNNQKAIFIPRVTEIEKIPPLCKALGTVESFYMVEDIFVPSDYSVAGHNELISQKLAAVVSDELVTIF